MQDRFGVTELNKECVLTDKTGKLPNLYVPIMYVEWVQCYCKFLNQKDQKPTWEDEFKNEILKLQRENTKLKEELYIKELQLQRNENETKEKLNASKQVLVNALEGLYEI